MIIYFIIAFVALVASAFIFFESIVISSVSIVPIGIICLSILQAVIFKSMENEDLKHSSYNFNQSTREIDYEATKLAMRYHALTKIAIIPLLCIFIMFFASTWKTVFSIGIYFLSYFPVRILVKYSKNK